MLCWSFARLFRLLQPFIILNPYVNILHGRIVVFPTFRKKKKWLINPFPWCPFRVEYDEGLIDFLQPAVYKSNGTFQLSPYKNIFEHLTIPCHII